MDLSCRLLWILDMQILHSLLPSHHFCISIHLSGPSNHLATSSSLSFNHVCLRFALSVPSSQAILDLFCFCFVFFLIRIYTKLCYHYLKLLFWVEGVWQRQHLTGKCVCKRYDSPPEGPEVFPVLFIFIYILRQEFWIDGRHLPRNFIFFVFFCLKHTDKASCK